MAEPISDEQLAEIRSRAAAATPGPWTWSPGRIDAPASADNNFGLEVVMWVDNIPGEYEDGDDAAALGACGTRAENDAAANLAFLAAARQDMPALLAEVDRLREVETELSTLRGRLREEWRFNDGMGDFTVKRGRLSGADVQFLARTTGHPVEHRYISEWQDAATGGG